MQPRAGLFWFSIKQAINGLYLCICALPSVCGCRRFGP